MVVGYAVTLLAVIMAAALPLPATLTPPPPLTLNPSMTIYVFSDGSFSINYSLNALIPGLGNSTSGSARLAIKYFESDRKASLSVIGWGSFAHGVPAGKAVRISLASLSGWFEARSIRGKGLIIADASAMFKTVKEAEGNLSRSELRIDYLNINATPDTVSAEFMLTVSGVNFKPNLTLNVNSSNAINSRLRSAGVDYLKFKELVVSNTTKGVKVSGALVVNLSKVLGEGVRLGILRSEDVVKLRKCFINCFKALNNAVGKYELAVVFTDFKGNSSVIKFKVAANTVVNGDMREYANLSNSMSSELSKLSILSSIIANQVATALSGKPSKLNAAIPPPITYPFKPLSPPKLLRIHPYMGSATLVVNVVNGGLSLKLNVVTGRLKWVGKESPSNTAMRGLIELRNYLSNLSRKLSFIKPLSLKSVIPSSIKVVYVSEGGKEVASANTSLNKLPYVGAKLVAEGAATTKTPPKTIVKTVTLTKTSTVTVTETLTKVVSKELTTVIIKTNTVTATKTMTSTATTATSNPSTQKTLTITSASTITKYVKEGLTVSQALLICAVSAAISAVVATALAISIRRRV